MQTKKQKQRRRERRRHSLVREQQKLVVQRLRAKRRRLRPQVERIYLPPERTWLVVEAMPLRAARAARELRLAGLPVFEARRQEKLTAENGKERVARVPVLRRVMFVGIARLADLGVIEACRCVSRVLVSSDGAYVWTERERFRHTWIEAETFGGARMPTVSTPALQRFADHVTGFLKDDGAVAGVFTALFGVGASVRVKDGPFALFDGKVESFDADEGRYKVSVSVFGRTVPVELEENQMEAA